ncbi:MAG: AsmA family protein [Alphaproteobacteria bacterium]|nr:AsmA family protein [Alphaproteobacteria bacterium]
MKKLILLIVAVLAVIAGVIYYILPGNYDWNNYVKNLILDVKVQTGLDLKIEGSPTFSMTPTPMIKVGKISLSNVANSTFDKMLEASQMEVQFDKGLIFKRQYKIKKILLKNAKVYLERLGNGKWNLQEAFLDKQTDGAKAAFDSLLFNDSEINVRVDKYATVQTWKNLNAELLADTVFGPFSFEGNFSALKSKFSFSFRIEKFSKEQSPKIILKVTNADAEAIVNFEGLYGLTEKDKGKTIGNLSFEIRKTAGLFKLFSDLKLPEELFKPIQGTTKLISDINKRENSFNDFLAKYGEGTACSGKIITKKMSQEEARESQKKKEAEQMKNDSVALVLRDPLNPTEIIKIDELPEDDIKIADNLLPKSYNANFIFSKIALDDIVHNFPIIFETIGKNENLKKGSNTYNIDLIFDSGEYNKNLVKSSRLIISTNKNQNFDVIITGTLPGGTSLNSTGEYILGETPIYSSQTEINSEEIGTTLKWLGINIGDNLPQNAYHHFKGKADLKTSTAGMVLNNVEVVIDKTKLTGGFAVRLSPNKNIYKISTNISNLNLSLYFSDLNNKFNSAWEEIKSQSLYNKLVIFSEKLEKWLTGIVDIKLETDSLTWADFDVKNLKTDISIKEGNVQIKEFSADSLWKGKIKLSGNFDRFGINPAFNDLKLSLSTDSIPVFANNAGLTLPDELLKNDRLTLDASFKGTINQFDFESNLNNDDMNIVAKGSAKRAGNQFVSNFDLDAKHNNLRRFVLLFTDKYKTENANPGSFSIKGTVINDQNSVKIPSFEGTLANETVSGSYSYILSDKTPVINIDLTAPKLSIYKLMPRLNLFPASPDNNDNLENPFEKSGLLENISSFSMPKTKIDLSFLDNYSANISIQANELLTKDSAISNAKVVAEIDSSKLNISLKEGSIFGSPITGEFKFQDVGGLTDLNLSLSLSGIKIKGNLFNSSDMDISNINQLSLSISGNGKGASLYDITQTFMGTATVNFDSLNLSGIAYNLIPNKLKDITESTTEADLSKSLRSGASKITKGNINLSIQNGGMVNSTELNAIYNSASESFATLTYNLLTGEFQSSLLFKSDIQNYQELPALKILVLKQGNDGIIVSDNASEILAYWKKQTESLTAQRKQREEDIKKHTELKKANELATHQKRLLAVSSKLALSIDNLERKVSELEPYKEQYLCQRYYTSLAALLENVMKLHKEIQEKTTSTTLTSREVNEYTQKANEQMHNKEKQVNEDFNTGISIGYKSDVYDYATKANEYLDALVKSKIKNPWNEVVLATERVASIVPQLNEKDIKAKNTSAQEELKIIRSDALHIFKEIESIYNTTNEFIESETKRLEAEKQAAEEEARKKKEIEDAERKRQEELLNAIEKKRKGTIKRKIADDEVEETLTTESTPTPVPDDNSNPEVIQSNVSSSEGSIPMISGAIRSSEAYDNPENLPILGNPSSNTDELKEIKNEPVIIRRRR